MKYYQLSIEETLEELKTNETGLTDIEANERLAIYGKNKLKEAKKQSKIMKFLNEFNDLMIIILCIAAIISFIISYINNEPFTDGIIILAIVILNAVLGFIQELKADQAIDSLKKLQTPKVKVKRNNKTMVINSEDIVIGDVLVLEAGDSIPADARVIWQVSLKVDESSLTGESVPATKSVEALVGNIPLSERKNLIYAGCNVVYGKCLAVVFKTGMQTEIGAIASSLEIKDKELTPLQKKINEISKILSLIIAGIIFLMFVIGVLKGMNFTDILLLSISLAVAAIPEGLPAVITVTLSLGMSTMAKKKAIVRKMASVETLGCTEIICSDKTGTITQNKMQVVEIYFDNKFYDSKTKINDNILTDIVALNNDSSKNLNDYIGDPTEIAMYEYLENMGYDVENIRKKYPRENEIPFDSERKMMSTINKVNNESKLFTKGSFDSIIDRCSKIYENGKIIELDSQRKKELKNIEMSESDKALRVLAFAYKNIDNNKQVDINVENNLIFIGLIGMMDLPRIDVKEAISICKEAHIKPIMITGDSLSTATAIAREVGILNSKEEAIEGVELDNMSEEQLKELVPRYSVYARVSPINKLSIVNAWKANNKIVAMTGDGVNDAPALKTADIGIGMGITGTEVSKSVSDIILADDSFSTIVTAVKEGRRIFDNIRNVILYLLTGNIAEVLVVFIGMIFGFEIFLPIQLLYINLITDSIPAIALAFEKEADDVMKRDIRKKDSSFFTPFLLAKIALSSILKTLAILFVYFVFSKLYSLEIATTMSFLCLTLLEMIFAYSCRNLKKSVLNKDLFGNRYINNSILLLMIIELIIFITPVRKVFNLVPLSIGNAIWCIGIALITFIIDELSKNIINKKFKD